VDDLRGLIDRDLVVDVHFHLGVTSARFNEPPHFTFEKPAISDGYAAYLSPRALSRLGFRVGRWLYGLGGLPPGEELDRRMERVAVENMDAAPSVDRAVALAFDQYHTADGQAVQAAVQTGDCATDLFVSNSYVLHFCRRHPGRFLFGASIHPYRAGALDALRAVAEAGAVLVKWLPIVQNIDITDERTIAFVRLAAKLHMPLLIHYGGEKTLTSAHPEYADPEPLFEVLERLHVDGVSPMVIIAHAAVGTNWPIRMTGYVRETTAALIGPLRDRPIFADTSAAALLSRAHWLKRFAHSPAIAAKLIFGTDFPIPPSVFSFRGALGPAYDEVSRLPSVVERHLRVHRALGFDEAYFRRGWRLLREGLARRIDAGVLRG
jgi:predicted TIM-barrel fold metal-dependent hydrolase